MEIKYTCSFIPDREKGRTDCKLRCRVRWDASRRIVSFGTGYRIDPEKWSRETQRCKLNTTHGRRRVPAARINRAIQGLSDIVEEVFAAFSAAGHDPSEDELRDAVNTALGRMSEFEDSPDHAFGQFIAECGSLNAWSDGTYRKLASLRRKMYGSGLFRMFEDFTEDNLARFVAYLRSDCGLQESTCAKNLALLKWFLGWASRKGMLGDMSFRTFSPKFRRTEKPVIFLTWDELMRLEAWDPPVGCRNPGTLRHVRDVFCFCCFTSLRYSDVSVLRRSSVHEGYITVTSVKTSDRLKIELNRHSSAILERYADADLPGGLALPVMSNQKMNVHLKDICRMCGIDAPVTSVYYRGSERIEETLPKWRLVGTHAGRRTFICNALMMGIPPQIVMKWTGHSDYKAMRPYIDVADSAKATAMRAFDRD